MLKVLSLNCYTLGHSTYQNILEQTFKTFGNEIDFESLHLTDYYSKDTAGRILHYILRKRIPGSGNTDYDFYRLRLESANSFFAYRYLQRRLNDLIPDVLHIHTQSITYLMDSILAQIPSIISIDMTYANLARIHKFPSKITYYPLKLLEKKSFNAANHIICCSNWARESVIKDYKIPPNKVSTIYYGMPIKSFESIKNHNEYNESKIKLLFVRNDFNRKGGTDLISVFLKHFSESCELHLVTNQHTDEKLPDSIKLYRNLKPISKQLLELYKNADIFIMPTYEDVFGVVFLEAMASGLPCIGTNIMAIPEIIQDGVSGFIINPGDSDTLYNKMKILIEDKKLRAEMGIAGGKIVKNKFDSFKNCRSLLEVFLNCKNSSQLN